MLISDEINMNPEVVCLEVCLILGQQGKAMPLCPNITVKKAQTAFLHPLIADLLCESNTEEINYLISSGLSRHLKRPKLVVTDVASSTAPATPLLGAHGNSSCGVPALIAPGELLLDGPVVKGSRLGVLVEEKLAVHGNGQLAKRSHP
ncbi:hypothetical protein VE02_10385 [Pseudogymnoascus sp. 03VT05]|nr:hypothetical protein VE02_10385 [Pseudogymnoascus sp. 03VT05]